jgi:hypothetical protein
MSPDASRRDFIRAGATLALGPRLPAYSRGAVRDPRPFSSMVELSIRSVRGRGKPQGVPDFTQGGWKEWAAWPIVEE